MGIDGIGKPGPGAPGGIGNVGGSSPVAPGESFKVDRASPTSSAAGSEALGRLQRGEISADEYLDARVSDAVAHLAGKLPGEQLQFVKDMLREQMSTDPVLIELVRRTTS